jgi:hypothetical protein
MGRMRRSATSLLFLFILTSIAANAGAVKQPPTIIKDVQAIAVVQSALTAMGETAAVGYQDSVANGTLTFYVDGSSVAIPITLKSKGTQETRVELQRAKGTTVRIVNQGAGVIEQPDGTVRWLLMNNTLIERVTHLPLFSLLGAFQDPTVSVENLGTAKVSTYTTNVVALRPLVDPAISQTQWDQSLSKTMFYVDQASGLVVKISYTNFAENNPNLSDSIEVYLSNYQSVNGTLIPMRQTSYTNGTLESDLVVSSIAFNQGLSDTEFALPQKASTPQSH